ncbi:MAG: fibronectin type III domain-containing protein [Candidatus Omnitrophica bacterium]|nr:fibronectin type III domain-containing protein [Candidatus Omnitrophota bacterium]
MKGRIGLLVLVFSLASFVRAFAECKAVVTLDFQGTVCTEASGSERRDGKWIIPGGMFTGVSNLEIKSGGAFSLSKDGAISSADFQGNYHFDENADPAGKIASMERWDGKWMVSPQLVLVGVMTIERSPDGKVTVTDNRNQQTSPDHPPLTPTNLKAQAAAWDYVVLTWKDNSNNEDGFKIEARQNNTNFVEIKTVPLNSASCAISGLKGNTKYYFRIRAYNAAGNSAYSNIAIVTTPQQPAPKNLVAKITYSYLPAPKPGVLVVRFSGVKSTCSNGTITSYAWVFSDGAKATGAEVTHTFPPTLNPNGYVIAGLTVKSSKGETAVTDTGVPYIHY